MTKDEFAQNVCDLEGTMYRVSYSMLRNTHDQADAIQESISRAWEKLPSLREPRYFNTWIIRILMNVCRDVAKRKSREYPSDEIEVSVPEMSDGLMLEAMNRLDEKFRITLVLHHVEGYTTREIARIMKAPEGTVKYRLTRGRDLLRDILLEGSDDHEYAK